MDPAHNLHDIFQTKLGERGKKILPGLLIRESDMEQMSRAYLSQIKDELKGLYHYQQALNIDKYFDILKYAPGTEEYASLLVLERCYENQKYDEIIIDTPPTALTLKMLALPAVNLHWIRQLMKMRSEIVDKKNGVAHVRKQNQYSVEQDPIYVRLRCMEKRYGKLETVLKDTKTTELILVLNEDELSLAESLMIQKQLDSLGLQLGKVLLNRKTSGTEWENRISENFTGIRRDSLPIQNCPVIGLEILKNLAESQSALTE